MNFNFTHRKKTFTFLAGVLFFLGTMTLSSLFQNCGRLNMSNLNSPSPSPSNNNEPLLTSRVVNDSDLQCLPSNDTTLPVSPHLKYTGMLSSMGNDTIDYNQWKLDVSATLKMGNLQAVEFMPLKDDVDLTESFKLFKQKLEFLSQQKINILLVVQNIFFDLNGQLKKDYEKNWLKLLTAISPYQSSIKVIYPYDEPFWNIVSNQKKNNKLFVNNQTMYNNLTTAGLLMHKTLPNVPLVYVEGYPVVNEKLKIPDVFDWIGMDCYTGFENCEGRSIPEYYNILKKLKPGKKLVVLPPSMIFKKPEDILPADRMKVKDIFVKFMNWIHSETNIIASLSFIYTYRQTIEVFTSADRICESADIHRLFWKKFSRLNNEGRVNPSFSCKGWGPLNSYSMNGMLRVSNYDVNLPGHYFVAGLNPSNNNWYCYANGAFSLYDGSENSILSYPTPSLNETTSSNFMIEQDLTGASNTAIYIGYGVGASKMEAWNNMLANKTFSQCSILPTM